MIDKNYYYKKELEILKNISLLNKKPTLLLHVCCAPCASYPLLYLCEYFDITLFYSNSNMDSVEEYEKRFNEFDKLNNYFYSLHGYKVKIVKDIYNNSKFIQDIKGYENELEGGIRCNICFNIRLDSAFNFAKENKYDFVATTLTVSRFKNSNLINEIGESLSKLYSIKYLYSDFKKNKGEEKGNKIAKDLKLYKQCYCGCIFSKLNANHIK